MDPLSATASIITVLELALKVSDHLNVKDAPKERLRCWRETVSLCSLLTELKCMMKGEHATEEWFSRVRALTVENGPMDQFKQTLEQLQAKVTSDGRVGEAVGILTWNFNKKELRNIFERMERLKSSVQLALEMAHIELSRAIKDDTSATRDHIATINVELNDMQKRQESIENDKMVAWLSTSNYPAQQSDHIERRQKETGLWFLNSPDFRAWLDEPKGSLFCPGIPGAGKTMIAAVAIDHLLVTKRSSTVGVAYIYHNYKEKTEQTLGNLLSAVLKQLVQGQPSMAKLVMPLYEKHTNQGTRPTWSEFYSAIESVCASHSTVYIVLDALDECGHSENTCDEMLDQLRNLQLQVDVRLMATSRFIPDIVQRFVGKRTIEVRASDHDVKRFIEGQIPQLPRCIKNDPALQAMVQEKIVEAVDGMKVVLIFLFLLARLYVDSLVDKKTKKDVNLAINQLSKGTEALNKAYDDAIHRIEGQLRGDYEHAKMILSWITYAQRPLTTMELCEALAVEFEEEELDPDNVPDPEELASVCAGLVTVDEASSIIRLVHYTAQEYFEGIRAQWIPDAQFKIASTCLTYLSFRAFAGGPCLSDDEFENRVKTFRFLDYAARFWGIHVEPVQEDVCKLACSFLLDDNCVCSAVQVSLAWMMYSTKMHESQRHTKGVTIVHLMAQFGLTTLFQEIASMPESKITSLSDEADEAGSTPLMLAAQHGHISILKLLLARGSDVNAQGDRYGNALLAASSKGHDLVAEVLVDQGANVNAHNILRRDNYGYAIFRKLRNYDTALHAASGAGYERIVELLLKRGADPNIRGAYRSALQNAAWGGHKQVVKLLLDYGADIDATSQYTGTALRNAAETGHKEIVELLLENGADVDSSALRLASLTGHQQIVQLLLDRGADINSFGFFTNGMIKNAEGSALHAALCGGHPQIAKLLIEKGADLNSKGQLIGSILQLAAEKGYQDIVTLLIDKGVDVNPPFQEEGSAIQAAAGAGYEQLVRSLLDSGASATDGLALRDASEHGHVNIVKLLLAHGAGPLLSVRYRVKTDFSVYSRYGTALEAASRQGHMRVVELLLDRDLNAHADDRHSRYKNALYAAAEHGHQSIVELLLEKGANADTSCEQPEHSRTLRAQYYPSALFAAIKKGHQQIAKLLIGKGASISYEQPLQAASESGSVEIVKLLLDKGAEVNRHEKYKNTALESACAGGHENIVRLLLDRGADVNLGYAVYAAASNGHEPIVRLLLEAGAKINRYDEYDELALQAASFWNHKNIVTLLLDNGAEINKAVHPSRLPLQELVHFTEPSHKHGGLHLRYGSQLEGETALEAASAGGHMHIVSLLLDKGANINGGTALRRACSAGHVQIAQLLLNQGADVNSGDALAVAAERGYADIVELLLKNGADPDKGNALRTALEKGRDHVAKLLLENGAHIDRREKDLKNLGAGHLAFSLNDRFDALDAACRSGNEHIVKVLLDRGADPNNDTALWNAAWNGHIHIIKLLLGNGADISKFSQTLMPAAVEGGDEKIVELLYNYTDDKQLQIALRTAFEASQEHIIEFLIQKGVSLEQRGLLQLASARGSIRAVKLLLDKGIDIDSCHKPYSYTKTTGSNPVEHYYALHAAAANGHIHILKLLLNIGANVNIQNEHSGSALQAALQKNSMDIVKALLQHSADVNAQSGKHGTALQMASAAGADHMVKLLLSEGADVNAQTGKYGTALQVASLMCHVHVVQELLDHGANINARGGMYDNALQAAATGWNNREEHEMPTDAYEFPLSETEERYQIVKLLLNKGADPHAYGGAYGSALQAAAAEGYEEIVKLLLDKGADVNAQGGMHGNALNAATVHGHTHVVQLLLAAGAEVNAPSAICNGTSDQSLPSCSHNPPECGTALQNALAYGYYDIVKLLLNSSADANLRVGCAGAPLYQAAKQGDLETVKILIAAGANVNAVTSSHHDTALSAATESGSVETMKLLLQNGAKWNIQDEDNSGALYFASRFSSEEAVKLLIDSGTDVNVSSKYDFPLIAAAECGRHRTVQLLLENGADPNSISKASGTALQVSAARGSHHMVQVLLDHGADPNRQDGVRYGTPLQAAAQSGSEQVVALLLAHGADVNVQGGKLGSAILAALVRGRESVAKMLLQKGADIDTKGGEYGTPYQVASQQGFEEIMSIMRERIPTLADNGLSQSLCILP